MGRDIRVWTVWNLAGMNDWGLRIMSVQELKDAIRQILGKFT